MSMPYLRFRGYAQIFSVYPIASVSQITVICRELHENHQNATVPVSAVIMQQRSWNTWLTSMCYIYSTVLLAVLRSAHMVLVDILYHDVTIKSSQPPSSLPRVQP